MLRKLFSFFLLFSLAFTAHAQVNLLFHQGNGPVAGNPKGKITVVEFFDYQCSHCVHMAPVISAIIKANPDVRVVFKEFPIRGPVSEFAARAALAANKQGKYYSFSHALLAARQPLSKESILEIAKAEGLNLKKLEKDMNSPTTTQQLNTTLQLAQQLKLPGTPAFFIGKTNTKNSADINYIPGAMSQSELQDAIDNVRKA